MYRADADAGAWLLHIISLDSVNREGVRAYTHIYYIYSYTHTYI